MANLGAAAHAAHEPNAEYLRWETVAQAVRNFWLLVGSKLKDRAEAWPRVRLPARAEEEADVIPRLNRRNINSKLLTLKDLTDVWLPTIPLLESS
eukprot:5959480-Amphidinium_carterae.2